MGGVISIREQAFPQSVDKGRRRRAEIYFAPNDGDRGKRRGRCCEASGSGARR